MKIWKKISLENSIKEVDIVSKSLTNYIYSSYQLSNIISKYNISNKDIENLNKYTTDRVAGLLLLYISKNNKRINDIVNKYNTNNKLKVEPVVEGYVEK